MCFINPLSVCPSFSLYVTNIFNPGFPHPDVPVALFIAGVPYSLKHAFFKVPYLTGPFVLRTLSFPNPMLAWPNVLRGSQNPISLRFYVSKNVFSHGSVFKALCSGDTTLPETLCFQSPRGSHIPKPQWSEDPMSSELYVPSAICFQDLTFP